MKIVISPLTEEVAERFLRNLRRGLLSTEETRTYLKYHHGIETDDPWVYLEGVISK